MRLETIEHRSAFMDCYAYNENEIIIRIRTGKEITAVNLIHDDPYLKGISPQNFWSGQTSPMMLEKELKYAYLWSIRLKPEFKREQYYFEIWEQEEKIYLLEDDFYTEEEMCLSGRINQYFKYPWLNESDVNVTPKWVRDTVWYQIMPDRFRRGDRNEKRMPLQPWDKKEEITYSDFFGGDLRGIIDKLDYLKDLGITGIYFTPLFESTTNHKYNTTDYTRIDPDFGTEAEMRELIKEAHKREIRIMMDAVFNHSGTHFFAWQDVLEKGKDSPYFDWFYINKFPLDNGKYDTKDGRYYSFAFVAEMPKLNTNNKQVCEYLTNLCRHWVSEWEIDGIRFDVGNEVSHSFLKQLRKDLKEMNPELFLLGEIWHDSASWLLGDEYDSVMNYPFLESLNNYYLDKDKTSRDFMYAMNRCYALYQEQTNEVLFNFLDSHDIGRVYSRYEDMDIFFQQLTVLLTMQGSPCIYYGTEIAMPGGHDPENRRCMPWEEIESGVYDDIIEQVKQLIAIRRQYPRLREGTITWKHDTGNSRVVCYEKENDNTTVTVCLNAGETAVEVDAKTLLFSRKFENGRLAPGGTLVYIRRT